MTNRITFLGTKGGPSIRKGGPNPSSSLLRLGNATCVIDCGVGVVRAVVEAGTPLTEIDAIFITHLHSDHLLDLGPLLYTAWTSGLDHPIEVFGPEGIWAYWDGFLQSMSFDHSIRTADEKRAGIGDLVKITAYGEGTVGTVNDLSVTALRVDHPPVEHCYALRFEAFDRVVVFSGDTCYFPPLARFAAHADVLVHEAMLGAGIDALVARMKGAPNLRGHLMASHTMVEDVGRIATAAAVGHLVLNHLVPADDPNFDADDWKAALAPTWAGPVTVAHDGATINLD